MCDPILNTFPGNDVEALAMLYVQSQDLSGLTPEDLVHLYDEAYEAISAVRESQQYANRNWT